MIDMKPDKYRQVDIRIKEEMFAGKFFYRGIREIVECLDRNQN